MKKVFKIYRVPIIVTSLMLIGIAAWAIQQANTEVYENDARIKRDAERFFTTIESSLYVFGYNNLDRQKFKFMLRNIIKNSPLIFVVIKQEDNSFLKFGKIPKNFNLNFHTDSGKQNIGNYLVYWNTHIFPNKNYQFYNQKKFSGDTKKLCIIIGLQYHSQKRHGGPPHKTTMMIITLTVALLFIAITFIAWIMLIRSRILSVELQTQRLNSQYLEELGLAAAGLAHETKNPLGIILGLAQQIEDKPNIPKDCKIKVEQIIDEVDTASARLGNFMTYAKHCELKKQELDIKQLLSRVIDIIRPDFDSLDVKLVLESEAWIIYADEDKFRQILVNLLLNSLHASKSGSIVKVKTLANDGLISLIISDNGSGISSELLPNVFKPYTAGNPNGHGLGLSITKRFVNLHNWTIKIESNLNIGTTVCISGIELVVK